MTTFWLITALLVLFSMAMLVWPIVMPGNGGEEEGDDISDKETNITYFREQADELEAQVKAGLIATEEAEALRQELEKKLLADVAEKQEEVRQSGQRHNLSYAVALAVMIPVITLPLYFRLGATVELDVTDKLMSPTTTPEQTLAALEQWHSQRPDSAQAMFLLGGQYLGSGDVEQALTVYRRLYQSTDGHFQAAEQLAQTLYIAEGREITDEIRRLVASTLAVEEMSPTALGLQGVDAFRQGDYHEAIRIWSLALSVEQNPGVRDELSAGIRDAREQLGLPNVEVRVNVSLAPELQGLPADTRVIVFAREAGDRMPVAAVPMSVAELPREIVLDDSSAMMMHGGGLGDFRALDLIGRISMEGDVSHPDYEAVVQAVEVGGSDIVELQISPAS